MIKVKYLILGAGPSGLSFASRLLQKGEKSFLVLEKEDSAGGLCRSKMIDGKPLDIGGGHFLDVRRKAVLDFVFDFLPEANWRKFTRISTIRTKDFEISYPYEANIWQLSKEEQIKHLISISQSGSNQNTKLPQRFQDWILWKLGSVIAENYMFPYNRKIFSPVDLNELGTYWLYKLPKVSFEDTLRSCLYQKPFGILPAHSEFYYPQDHGYGEVFRRMGEFLDKKLLLGVPMQDIDFDSLVINNEIQADCVINTIPWHEFVNSFTLPPRIRDEINQLAYSSIDIVYCPSTELTRSHWTYFPDESLSHHRILYRHNFIENANGYWKEINSTRLQENDHSVNHNKYAYPVNTILKPKSIDAIIKWGQAKSIIALGRWGEWEHMNSDIAIEKGIALADKFLRK